MKPKPRRILFIQTAFLGDVVFSTALLHGIARLYPYAVLSFLASPRGGDLLRGEREIDEVILYDKTGREKGTGAFLGLLKRVREKEFDLVVSPHRSLRSALIARFSGARRRLGFRSGWGAAVYNQGVPFPEAEKKPFRRELELLRPLAGDSLEDLKPRLTVGEEARREVRGLLRSEGREEERPLVALVTGTVWPTKKWPVEKFLQLGRGILASGRAQVLLVGGPGQQQEAACFSREEGFINIVGRTSLRQLPAVLESAAVLVAADTGPLHAAMALSVPVVALFGPTDEEQFEFAEVDSCLTVDLECRPCSPHGGRRCPVGNWRCLPEITVARVLSSVLEKIDPQGAGDYNSDHFHDKMRTQER